ADRRTGEAISTIYESWKPTECGESGGLHRLVGDFVFEDQLFIGLIINHHLRSLDLKLVLPFHCARSRALDGKSSPVNASQSTIRGPHRSWRQRSKHVRCLLCDLIATIEELVSKNDLRPPKATIQIGNVDPNLGRGVGGWGTKVGAGLSWARTGPDFI